jgi:SAM-dependent methyltransferase
MFQPDSTDLVRRLIEHALKDTRGPKRSPISRLSMHRKLRGLLTEEDAAEKRCLCISKSEPLADLLGVVKANRDIANYPDVDMLQLPYVDGSFDFVLSDQVMEHVAGNPFKAASESVRVAKPGGWIVHTTCFIQFMHDLASDGSGDYWRFTPQALRILMQDAGAEIVKVEGWGNQPVWTYMQMSYRNEKVPEVRGNPVFELGITNEPKWPIVTWVIARKPLG